MKLQRWLILPDAHTPYHDKRALEKLIIGNILKQERFHGVIVMGDWFDCYSVSRFTKDPRRLRGLKNEVKAGFRLLGQLESLPFAERIFIEGNHERRLPKALSERFPDMYEIAMDWWWDKFKQWKYIPYMEDTSIGKLFITHDVGRCGEHSTKQSLADYQDNVIIGHNHLLDCSVRGNAKGEAHVGASFGWLGDVDKIDYRHRMKSRRDWVLGFGTMYKREDGIVYVTAHPIVKYSAEIDGKIYTA